MATTLTLTVAQFRTDFPEFADTSVYSDASIQSFITQAQCYIHNINKGALINDCRLLAWELMTAHLQTIQTRILNGQTSTGQVGSTSIDGISVSIIPPPNKNQYEYWIGLTPYGQRYWALLTASAPAGFYFGGSNQRVLR